MIYVQTTRNNFWRRSKFKLRVIGAVVAVLVLIYYFVPHFYSGIFNSIARPYWRTQFAISTGSLSSVASLLLENEELKRQISELKVQNELSTFLLNENQELKNMLGRASSSPLTVASVLLRPRLAKYDELIIDLGKKNGLSTSTTVYGPMRIPIGRVSEISSETSRVVLYTSPGEKFPVTIGQNKYPGTAEGQGGGQYKVELPRDAKVTEGEMVYAPSLFDGQFGVVKALVSDAASPFETILFVPPINVYDLRWVFVDIKN